MRRQSLKSILGLFRVGISIDFDNLRAHCEFVRSSLNDEKRRFETSANEATKGLDEEQKAAFYEWNEQEAYHIYDVFPSLQWMSSFLLTYGIFEKTLNDICRGITSSAASEVSLNDIAGQGIERAKTYLGKVCGLKTPFETPEWKRVTDLSKIRNVIAHASGDLDLDKNIHKGAFEIAKSDKTLKVTRHDEVLKVASIQLTAEFSVGAVEALRSFLFVVCDAVADQSSNPPA